MSRGAGYHKLHKTGHVVKFSNNQRRGANILKNGNSQTLVNTAIHLADKLAGSGTDFKNAAEWVKMLRADVDAYNKLSPEQKTGLRGQTILGEMQAALGFAELQGSFAGVLKSVQEANEDTRATWAEMVNQTVDKAQRKRDYTASDIANNTDNIAWQIAVLKYVDKSFDIDGSIADYVQESGINEKIAKEQAGAENNVEDTHDQYDLKDAIKTLGDYDDVRKRHIESNENDKITRDYNEIADFINNATKHNPVKRLHIGVVNPDVAIMVKSKTNIDITNYDFVIASNFIAHIFDEHGNPKTETPRGQIAVDKSNIEDIIETVIQPDDVSVTTDNQGAKALKFEKDINGRNVAITITSTKKSTLTLKSAWIINKKSGGRTPSANANAFAGTSKTNGRSSTKPIIRQKDGVVNPESEKNIDKADLADKAEKKAQEGEKKSERGSESKSAEKSGEVKDEGKTSEKKADNPSVADSDSSLYTREPKESLTDEQRREKARERAEKLLKWNEEQKPTAKELNEAREYVKGFDNLDISLKFG